ncbi:hypothetical protein PINS_up004605 [Pythium insidiosum]|nr:hypothetical protein PINS_up004605 [Pythium insidiosum]
MTSTPSRKRQRMDALIERGMRLAEQQQQRDSTASSVGIDRQNDVAGSPQASATSDATVISPAITTSPWIRKQTWTPEEDALLSRLVKELGTGNWAEIARQLPRWDRKRTRERFVNHLDPRLRRSAAWTPAEDEQLRALHDELGDKWATIASRLPGRSPEDVKHRWRELSTDQRRSKAQRWTADESAKLRQLVDTHGAKDWLFIASHLPPRTDLQCRQHWYRVLAAEKKGRRSWTPAEDLVLLEKVQQLGHKWTEIARFLPGRLDKQCRERYLNHVDPSIRREPWSPSEDATLRRLQQEQPNNWVAMANALPGRPENAIKNRWHALRTKPDRPATSCN